MEGREPLEPLKTKLVMERRAIKKERKGGTQPERGAKEEEK